MGKAPTWTPQERETVALAWLRATNNGIQGADQKSEDFRNKIHAFVKALSPREVPLGRFYERPAKAIYVFLRDNVFPDVNKFNESLRLIQASHPTGVNEDNILSMAIALHLGKTNRMHYDFINYEHTSWPNYLAWKILRVAPKFRPPSPALEPTAAASRPFPADATTVDPTGIPSTIAIEHLRTPSASTVATLPTALVQPQPNTHSNVPPESPYSDQLRVQVKQAFEENTTSYLDRVKRAYEVNNKSTTTINDETSTVADASSFLDPSRGGRGAAMGNKKAKLEYHKNIIELEKNKRLQGIENSLSTHTKQNGEMQQVFKLRQLLKLAQTLNNNRLMKKVECEIDAMLDSEKEKENKTNNSPDDDDDSVLPPPVFED